MCEEVRKSIDRKRERGRKRENKGIRGTGYMGESETWSVTPTLLDRKKGDVGNIQKSA